MTLVPNRVVVVGSANIDLLARVDHVPGPGETLLAGDLVTRPGGKGANQAVAAHRMGARTTLHAAVGDDEFGRRVRASLAGAGLDVARLVTVPGAATGLAMICVAAGGENSIVVAPGANHRLGPAQLDGLPDGLGPGDVVLTQLEIPLASCLLVARAARRAGARVLLNAAPLPRDARAVLDDLLALTDVLIVNEGEALALSGSDSAIPAGAGGWAGLAADLCRLGPATCVITLGARGAVAATGTRTHHRPAFPVTAVDTTGAGDAFCGTLAAHLATGAALPDALTHACAAGALATTKVGAQAALATATEVDRFLNRTRTIIR